MAAKQIPSDLQSDGLKLKRIVDSIKTHAHD